MDPFNNVLIYLYTICFVDARSTPVVQTLGRLFSVKEEICLFWYKYTPNCWDLVVRQHLNRRMNVLYICVHIFFISD